MEQPKHLPECRRLNQWGATDEFSVRSDPHMQRLDSPSEVEALCTSRDRNKSAGPGSLMVGIQEYSDGSGELPIAVEPTDLASAAVVIPAAIRLKMMPWNEVSERQ